MTSLDRTSSLEPLVVGGSQTYLTTTMGQPVVAWGFNYDRDREMRLLEEYWDREWPKVVNDLRLMRSHDANIVRIHLQTAAFIDADGHPRHAALDRLVELVAVAEELDMYLDITGLACYRSDDPGLSWFNSLTEGERWEIQARFWTAVATAVRGRSAVAFFDLINEPAVPAARTDSWYAGKLGPFSYCQFLVRDLAGRDRSTVASDWTHKMTEAIRGADPDRSVTIGLLPNSAAAGVDPVAVAPHLDLLAVHVYPDPGEVSAAVEIVRDLAALGKPVIVEELFPLRCSIQELREFITQTRPYACGWIGFHWGEAPARSGHPDNKGLIDRWLALFDDLGPEVTRPAAGT